MKASFRRITGIPQRLRYSTDSSNTTMHKQRWSGVRCCLQSQVRILQNRGFVLRAGSSSGTRLLLKQMLPVMNCGISSVLDFASHFSVSQLCQESLGTEVWELSGCSAQLMQMLTACVFIWIADVEGNRMQNCSHLIRPLVVSAWFGVPEYLTAAQFKLFPLKQNNPGLAHSLAARIQRVV